VEKLKGIRNEKGGTFVSGPSDKNGKYNEVTPPPQVWFSADKTVTFQNGPIQMYSERSLKDGSVKTQYFIKATKQ